MTRSGVIKSFASLVAVLGFALTPISALAQHGGGGSHGGGGGGGFHGGGGGGFHSSGPSGGGYSRGGAEMRGGESRGMGASRGLNGSGARSAAGSRGPSGSGRGVGSSRNAESNVRPAIKDGQWHSFGNASAARSGSSLVARNTTSSLVGSRAGFEGGFRGEPFFGFRGGYGWGRGFGWGGWGFGIGFPYLGFYWGPGWAFWNPWWWGPYAYGYGPYLNGYGPYSYYPDDGPYSYDWSDNPPPYRQDSAPHNGSYVTPGSKTDGSASDDHPFIDDSADSAQNGQNPSTVVSRPAVGQSSEVTAQPVI